MASAWLGRKPASTRAATRSAGELPRRRAGFCRAAAARVARSSAGVPAPSPIGLTAVAFPESFQLARQVEDFLLQKLAGHTLVGDGLLQRGKSLGNGS